MVFFFSSKIFDILFFPGIILHAWIYQRICISLNIRIREIKYFQFRGNSSHYIEHSSIHRKQLLTLTGIPFVIMSLLGIVLILVAILTDNSFQIWGFERFYNWNISTYLLVWGAVTMFYGAVSFALFTENLCYNLIETPKIFKSKAFNVNAVESFLWNIVFFVALLYSLLMIVHLQHLYFWLFV